MKNVLLTILTITMIGCMPSNDELIVIENEDSEEVTFILELDTKENPRNMISNTLILRESI